MSALANQIGGHGILSARCNEFAREVVAVGIRAAGERDETWPSNVLAYLPPVPRHEITAWNRRDDRWAPVVTVAPVDVPPYMTHLGKSLSA